MMTLADKYPDAKFLCAYDNFLPVWSICWDEDSLVGAVIAGRMTAEETGGNLIVAIGEVAAIDGIPVVMIYWDKLPTPMDMLIIRESRKGYIEHLIEIGELPVNFEENRN